MPYHGMESSKPKDESKWITVGGKKIEIKDGEDLEEKVSEKPESLRGQKESNTKESRKFIKRYGIKKSLFKLRDNVIFDKYTNVGVIYSLDGDYVKILSKGQTYERGTDDVYKVSELTKFGHWDTMELADRLFLLKISGISNDFMNTDWYWLSPEIKKQLLKSQSPNGMEGQGGYSTNTPNVYNPINDEKTLHERIKEEKKPNSDKKDEKE